MSGPPFDLRAAARGFAHGWQQFFWSEVDPRVCAAIRIGFALAILLNLACWYPDLDRWFTAEGVLRGEQVVDVQFWSFLPLGPNKEARYWSIFQLLPETSAVVHGVYWIFVVQTVMLLLGVAARFNVACVLVWLVSFQNRNPLIWDSEDEVLRLIGWCVLLMPLASAWTIHDLWRRDLKPRSQVPALGLRLLQVQMCVIFLCASWAKFNGEAWRAGTALYYVSRLDDYFGRAPLPYWIFDTPWLSRGLTWLVIAIELTVPLGIWFRQTRLPMLGLVLLFHLGNEVTMHLYLFHWLMLIGWMSFLQPSDFKWRVT